MILENLFSWFFNEPLLVIGDFHILPALVTVPVILLLPNLLEQLGVFKQHG